MQPAVSKLEAERAEMEALLSSGELGRTNNLVRLLTFVCEKYFEGAIDEVKEYSIAVHALGRPESFDPQVDTIVRVTAHALRKRLEDYYRTAGAEHAVHICLPPGHYVPRFIHKIEAESGKTHLKLDESKSNGSRALNDPPSQEIASLEARQESPAPRVQGSAPKEGLEGRNDGESSRKLKLPVGVVKIAAIIVLSACVVSLIAWQRWNRASTNGDDSRTLAAPAPVSISGRTLRAIAANSLAPYVDRSGSTWESDHFCSGGSPFSVTGHAIQGTEDQQLYSSGRRGIFHCKYPVPPGTYEMRLLFAETSGLQEASRNVGFSINGGPTTNLDVVDEAGGDDIATAKVFTDVVPESDGAIHLDFNNSEAFLNAIEILPGTPHRMLPVRIVVGHSPYRDSNGNVWVSDRYFFGGRLSSFGGDLSKLPDGRLYDWHRFGHFHYVVPVVTGGKYTLKLYFMEHWFGVQNGGIGGVGSRVFDVSCNGSMLLKGFDIFREAGSQPLVKSFPHIEPTPQGKIEIYFTPAVNYPSISAIEVLPE
ncbi:MAG TPA: malectin domain-containing carbohydrate-binding protein [Candidatus Acidoferrum sp.]|nr:malectin domain-containing carbohydrate-binding protein [Candidatus Acidoferrum sp.]